MQTNARERPSGKYIDVFKNTARESKNIPVGSPAEVNPGRRKVCALGIQGAKDSRWKSTDCKDIPVLKAPNLEMLPNL